MTNKHAEDDQQKALIKWCRNGVNARKYPGLNLIFAIMNGSMLGGHNEFFIGKNGRRVSKAAIRGKRYKEMGLLPGVADLFLPIPRRGYHGLFIELKSAMGAFKHEQLEFGRAMFEQGYAFGWSRTWDGAARIIINYWGGIHDTKGQLAKIKVKPPLNDSLDAIRF